jgi:DNA-binding YbaB/EbfC family protein
VGQQFKMLKQLQQMQERVMKVQEELGDKTVEGTAGGGMVTVVATGHQKVLSVQVKPEVVDPADVEMLQDLVLAAVNDALEKARALAQKELGAVTGGLGLPGGGLGGSLA